VPTVRILCTEKRSRLVIVPFTIFNQRNIITSRLKVAHSVIVAVVDRGYALLKLKAGVSTKKDFIVNAGRKLLFRSWFLCCTFYWCYLDCGRDVPTGSVDTRVEWYRSVRSRFL